LGRYTNAGGRQNSPHLHALNQGLHRGSFQNLREQLACRFDCGILRQACKTSQVSLEASRRVPNERYCSNSTSPGNVGLEVYWPVQS
jgi:hypothetical protein